MSLLFDITPHSDLRKLFPVFLSWIAIFPSLLMAARQHKFQKNLAVGEYVVINKNIAGKIESMTNDFVDLQTVDGTVSPVKKRSISMHKTLAYRKKQKDAGTI